MRLVHLKTNGMTGHCGLIINTGSADEREDEHGIAHLIEHMLFKGTQKRKTYHILSRLDDVGGELNAYTTKEETAIHASFLNEHLERAMELIADIAFRSTFPVKEIEKEKEVVLDEINSYRDNPAELIFDEFEEMIFGNHPIGRNILGNPSTIKSLSREKILDFINRNYSTDRMVFCTAGNFTDSFVLKLFEKHFSGFPSVSFNGKSRLPVGYNPVSITKKMDTWQCHCIMGNIAYSLSDDKRIGLYLLNNLLGGPGLNSRLNLSLRERNGLAYNVESSYNPYHATGVFTIYFGTDCHNLGKSMELTYRELDRLRTSALGSVQLGRMKTQLKGYLARGLENHENHMLSLGKNLLVFDRIDSIEEIHSRIDRITASDLIYIAEETFGRGSMSVLIYS